MNPGLVDEQIFVLRVGTLTIGRTRDNEVFCTHKSLSRRHARVEYAGDKVTVTDLQSKNGVYFNGKRSDRFEVVEGDSFRCGDITFLIEAGTTRSPSIARPALSKPAQTLPSPLAADATLSRRPTRAPGPIVVDEDHRYKEKLNALIRGSELLVSALPLDKLLDELVVLTVQMLEVDRVVLLMLEEQSLEMRPRVTKTFVLTNARPYSKRVVDWVVDHGSPTSFPDVSTDTSLPGPVRDDAGIFAAMCAPIDPGGGTIGVLYADSTTKIDSFRPEDVALVRAIANLAAVAMENDALRRVDRISTFDGT